MNYSLFEEIAFQALARDSAYAGRENFERKSHLPPNHKSYLVKQKVFIEVVFHEGEVMQSICKTLNKWLYDPVVICPLTSFLKLL